MKKIIFLFFICFSYVNNSNSQNYNWITPNKTYLKLYIINDGICRIEKTDFTNSGINANSIDPRTIKVIYKGSQIPIFFQGEDDATFNDNDFFDFYGKRNYGGPTPYRNGFTNDVVYSTDEFYNLYSDTNIYWIDWGGSNGLRMQRSAFVSGLNYSLNYFFQDVHFEQDHFYYLGETTNPQSDFRYFSNERVVAESWLWKNLEINNEQNSFLTDTVTIHDVSPSTQLCSLKFLIYPVSFTNQVSNEHRVEIRINNIIHDTLITENLRKIDTTITFPTSLLNNNNLNTFTLHYIPLGNQFFYPTVHVDYFALKYPREFRIKNNTLVFRLFDSDSTSKRINVSGYNSLNQLNIYDIENNIRIENHSVSQDILTFTGKSNSKFEILNNNITRKPFKIISRQVKDLVSSTNGADYLIIYNKIFESQSEQLKNHRENFDNFRVEKADIQDIYDIFNYGIENPVAVRNFVKHVADNWQKPRLSYVCLFGRASLDPKRSSSSSEYFLNLVPTYGNPATDGYFVNFNSGSFTYFHQISIGRLPVYSVFEAQSVVDKIIDYDIQQPDRWWKKFLFITGGPDRSQQINFQQKSEHLIGSFITPAPISGQITRIYRNDSSGYITYNYRDSIKKEFDRGALIVNFIGHAASQDWEIGLENPATLNNGSKLPLVLSFTCYTGKNSEPNLRGFGENFLILPNRCAIGFVGTTGWSFTGMGDYFNDYMLRTFAHDSSRRIGDMVKYASEKINNDYSGFIPTNTINCYNLIGDPATKLLLSRTPEFDITQNDYTLSNPFPALGEMVKLSVFPKNLGTFADSLNIKFQLRKNGMPAVRKDTVIRNFGYLDTVDHFFSIDSIGNYTMTIVLDPAKNYPQKFSLNDSITFSLTLRNISYVPVKPLNNGLIQTPNFTFTGLNPNVNPEKNYVKVILQVDTLRTFDSPVNQTFNNDDVKGVSSNFNINLPVQNLNTIYFLRTNAIINDDSSGWSEIRKVIYNPDITDHSRLQNDSLYTIYTLKPFQYEEGNLMNVSYTPGGFVLEKFIGNLFIRSYGSNANEASYFTINNINYYSDGGANTGLNIAKVKRLSGEISFIKNFRMNSPSSSDSVVTFLNTFDNTDYIMTYIASHVADTNRLSQSAKSKFREFGSIYADSVTSFNQFDTWAFLGFLGADTTQTCEKFHRYSSTSTQDPLDCQLNPVFQRTSGIISQTYGAADKWKNFSWEQILVPNSSITFDIYGIDRDNVPVKLSSGLSENSFVNIDTINSHTYPNLRLEARLSIDTVSGLESPVFKSSNFKYIAPVELLPDNYSFIGEDTTVQEGDTVSFSVNYYNIGFIDASRYYTKWYVKNQGTELILKQDTIEDPLRIDSMRTSHAKFSTSNLRDPKVLKDTIDLYFDIFGSNNEIFQFNNTAITKFILDGDTLNPLMEVTYDGSKILNGDYVQSKPNIVLKFFDDSRMVITDTSNLRVFLDNRYVPYYINGVKNNEIDLIFPDDRFLQATVIYKPTLKEGVHKLRFAATDNSENLADSIVNYVVVDNSMKIYEMANYPNPMKTETNFMFKLSGELTPTTCKVKIYTVAGRLVKEINAPVIVGFNQIYWDGKDNDGDFIANGTYLYKFIIQGNSRIETSTQKLAVLR